ncbi:MAG: hypothetical protein MJ247_00930 [Alphaproteobacteria bacterium]|nr:hypothetical protein [Alphaproteobacteria bacterium]
MELERKLVLDVKALLMQKIKPSDIVILADKKLENIGLPQEIVINSTCKIREGNDPFKVSENINFFTLHKFKGLDSQVVLYINDRTDYLKAKTDYVGMSRARSILFVYQKK